jgi:RimJ/RimL family protein N-acetyltransferase
VPLLTEWHADPEVSRYWDDETFTEEQVRHRLDREAVDAWIVEEDGEPVGYLQSWWEAGVGSTEPVGSEAVGSADAGAGNVPRRGGLDGFLVPAARGRGIMPTAARLLAGQLLDEGWEDVTVDPSVWNERAIRAWAKAGFVEVSRDERVVLMRFRR